MEKMDRIVVTMRKHDSDSISKSENSPLLESRIGSKVLELINTKNEKGLPENVEPLPVRYQDGGNPPDIPA